MTMIVGWLACDQRGPASAYITSDSRFSWGETVGYDHGRKVFALKKSPDILGYCGDVVFSMAAISQVVTLADEGLLFDAASDSNSRSSVIFEQLRVQFEGYPSQLPIKIYHISRDISRNFHCYCYSWSSLHQWHRQELSLNTSQSGKIFVDGSGANEFTSKLISYERGDISGTSRNIFQCFCQTLLTITDARCGGAPQLVGLYRSKFNGIDFGVIYSGKKYCHGAPVSDIIKTNPMRWYNINFEICDSNTLGIRTGAMRQPNPNLNLATP